MFTKLSTHRIKEVMEDILNNTTEVINSNSYKNSSLIPINRASHHLLIRLSEEVGDVTDYSAPLVKDQAALYETLFQIVWQKIFYNSSDGLDEIAVQKIVMRFLRDAEQKIHQH